MQHRIILYIRVGAAGPLQFTSQPIEGEHNADAMLEQLVQLPGATGGDIETHVDGIGWVIGGTTEAESAVIIARRQEHLDACDEFREIVGRPRSDDPRIVL